MKNKFKIIIIVVFLTLLCSVFVSFTAGKYVYNSVWDYYLNSRGFYFESDLLDINTKKNAMLKWDGSDITFSLNNSLNNELVSEYDIEYTVTCEVLNEDSNYIECNLNNTNQSSLTLTLSSQSKCVNKIDTLDVSGFSKAECEMSGYVWEKEIFSNLMSFNLNLKDPAKTIDEVSVKITAESKYPYNKKLIGVFNLNKFEDSGSSLKIYYDKFIEYDIVTVVNTTDEDKCISISFDESNYILENKISENITYNTSLEGKINEAIVKIQKESNENFKMYKVNEEKVYTQEDLIIEEKEC